MSSSDPRAPRQVPPPPGSRPASAYSRFIPREELQGFASWQPGRLGPDAQPHHLEPEAAEPAAPTPEQIDAQMQAARQAGYQDGYRDGLVALESFKQTFAQQMTAQIGQLVQSFDREFESLEQQMAAALAKVATQLARQVVRDEIQSRPELVARVAQEALNAVLMSARHVVLRAHPEDMPLLQQGAGDAIAARGARLVADPTLQRGGVLVETDVGSIDAAIATRWEQAAQALGTDVAWEADA
jgi:flagellar assembly protein FliH